MQELGKPAVLLSGIVRVRGCAGGSGRAGAVRVLVLLAADGTAVDCEALGQNVAVLVIAGLGGLFDFPGVACLGQGLRLCLFALRAGGCDRAGERTGGIRALGLLPLVLAGVRVHVVAGPAGAFRLGVRVHVRQGADGGELEAQSRHGFATVVDHGGDVHPVAAVINLGLSAGMVGVEGDVKEAYRGIGGPHAADTAGGHVNVALDIDRPGGELVRQGKDLVGVIGGTGRGIDPGGGQGAGGHPEFVQVDGAGGFDVELIRRGPGEGAGAYQVAIDEVIDIVAG